MIMNMSEKMNNSCRFSLVQNMANIFTPFLWQEDDSALVSVGHIYFEHIVSYIHIVTLLVATAGFSSALFVPPTPGAIIRSSIFSFSSSLISCRDRRYDAEVDNDDVGCLITSSGISEDFVGEAWSSTPSSFAATTSTAVNWGL